jgi:F0F1-type ATP synthase membrane subunit b/b'
MSTVGDDFDQLGRAVARVLRDSFDESARVRNAGIADGKLVSDEARSAAEELLMSARAEAESMRTQALADARLIVLKAHDELASVGEMIAAERQKLDTDVRAMLTSVRRAVGELQREVTEERRQSLERATNEAAMILRQARLHHRTAAREVDRMIEAAAHESTRLRNAALEDAAAVAARVCAVVELGDAPVESEDEAENGDRGPNDDRRPNLRPLRQPRLSRRTEAG